MVAVAGKAHSVSKIQTPHQTQVVEEANINSLWPMSSESIQNFSPTITSRPILHHNPLHLLFFYAISHFATSPAGAITLLGLSVEDESLFSSVSEFPSSYIFTDKCYFRINYLPYGLVYFSSDDYRIYSDGNIFISFYFNI